jgi:HAE1 family hydrophobic/amphiphilic exporter-1
VRLGDLGNVLDSVQDTKRASWFNGQRAVVLAIQRQPGTNTVAVAERVKAVVSELRSQIPPSVEISTLNDRSLTVRASVDDVKFTLFLALCLVVMVIFLFLRNLRATAIPALALPMSLIATFAVMYLLNYSLDNLSLMALTLAVGFVVDDAIVVLENIVRHIEKGESVLKASINGSREITFTVISMTLSLVAVFIPVLFLGGLIGRLFQAFAVTIGVAILVSGFVSLTLTPMLCSRWLKPKGAEEERHGRLYRATERAWEGTVSWYERSLAWVMDRRGLALAFSVLILVGTVALARFVPKGFIPSEDQQQLRGTTETAEGTSYEAMVKHQQAAAAIVQEDPNVDGFMSAVGGGGSLNTVNQGRLFIHLKPRSEREMSADEVARSLSQKLAAVPGMRAFISNPPVLNIGGRSSKSEYQFTLTSSDMEALYEGAGVLERRLQDVPGLVDVSSDLQIRNPQVQVEIARDRAAALGIDVNQI